MVIKDETELFNDWKINGTLQKESNQMILS